MNQAVSSTPNHIESAAHLQCDVCGAAFPDIRIRSGNALQCMHDGTYEAEPSLHKVASLKAAAFEKGIVEGRRRADVEHAERLVSILKTIAPERLVEDPPESEEIEDTIG